MALYRLRTDPDAFDVALAPRAAAVPFRAFRGERIGDRWKPVEADLEAAGRRGNFLSFSTGVPIVDGKAWDALRPLIGAQVEALEMTLQGETIYALNVVTVLDCLDPERSEIERFDNGAIMEVRTFVFREGCADAPIFKQKGLEVADVFVDDRFREAVEKAGLEGADLQPVG